MRIGQLRIKFIWGAAKVITARWRFGLFGFYEHAKGYHNSGLVFSVRGLLILGLILAVMAYVAGATALYFWLDRRPHNYVTYTDTLLLPVRMEVVREKRGQGYIDEGIDDLKAQRWSEAEMKLRIGLSRYPQAVRARLALAEFYTVAQRRPQALKLLGEGLQVSPDYPGRRYLQTYFSMAGQGEEYDLILAACERYLAGGVKLEPKEEHWLRQQKINVLLTQKQGAAALAELAGRPEDAIYNEQRVLAWIELGRLPEAIDFLAAWRRQPGAGAQVLRLQVRAFREAGRLDEMEAALTELRALTPTDYTPYAYTIIQRAMAGKQAEAEAALSDYFLRFGANARSMQPLAQPLAEIGAVSLLEQYIVKLGEQGHDQRSALLLLVQAHLKNADWPAAAAALNRVRALGSAPASAASGMELIETLVAVVSNPAEGPQVKLLDYINRQPFPMKGYRTLIEPLVRAQRYEVALEVITRAERVYPGNATLATLRTETQTALAARQAAMVGEGPDAPGSFLAESDFMARLDAAMAAERWAEAAAALRDVQLAKPGWLAGRQADFYARQMRLSQEMSEPLEMLLAARLLLDGSLARAQTVVDFATTLHAQGEVNDAQMLLRELLRKMPSHTLSRRLLEDWQKKPEPAVPAAEAAPVESGS